MAGMRDWLKWDENKKLAFKNATTRWWRGVEESEFEYEMFAVVIN